MSKHHDRQGRKIGPGIPFTPWDQIKIGVDPDSKKPEKMQKSVAAMLCVAGVVVYALNKNKNQQQRQGS